MANTRSILLKARLGLVRRDLEDILGKLTPELLPWAPAEGMRTISGQLVEIVATELQLIALLKRGEHISDEAAAEIIGDCGNLENLRRAVSDFRQQTLDYLDSLSEAELAEEVPFDGGWLASLTLPTIPRAEVFLNIADHEWYHVGQLTSYLWARGEDPYSW
ncbi:MAG: DinB family protein [Armatimonas sp.]